jgi:serine/threonine protein kinase
MTAELVADRFEVEREVGHGAAGIVYRANDIATGRAVALKVMASTGDPSDGARLVREGQILSELDHPGIVRVVAFGHFEEPVANLFGRQYERGTPYVAMEWLDGEDLQARQRRAPLVGAPGARGGAGRWPGRSRRRTTRAWCTATSSPPTCSCARSRGRATGRACS